MTENETEPYAWRYREDMGPAGEIDMLFLFEPKDEFHEGNPGEVTIITW